MKIEGKTALITGGASGLGEATVRMIVAEGGNAVILDVNEERGAALSHELGERTLFLKTDVRSDTDAREALEAVGKRFGEVHILVNCAGSGIAMRTITREGPHDLRYFDQVVQLNLVGTFNMASKAAFAMSRNTPDEVNGERGVIINVASCAAFDGQIGQVAYSASKAGVAGMTLPMARDLGPIGIRVLTIAPGFFLTPLSMMLPEEHRQQMAESVLFPHRVGKSEEFSSLVHEIITNSYLNGEILRLDGGLRLPPKYRF